MRTQKQRRAPAERPKEILEAALELFVEKGFAGTRLDDVAERAGLSKAAIYLYFDDTLSPGRDPPGRDQQLQHGREHAGGPSRAGGDAVAGRARLMASPRSSRPRSRRLPSW